jgi:hypothetical protein
MSTSSFFSDDSRLASTLARLHRRALDEDEAVNRFFAASPVDRSAWGENEHAFFADKFVALEEEKCQVGKKRHAFPSPSPHARPEAWALWSVLSDMFVFEQFIYLLARSLNAQGIVEAGTSYGVSTIYLGAAVRDNVSSNGPRRCAQGVKPIVVGTEHEPAKVQSARDNLTEALGAGVFDYVDIREGDLRQTLPGDLASASVDLVLIDIWTHMALPALKAVKDKLAPGAVIIADNTKKAELSCTPFSPSFGFMSPCSLETFLFKMPSFSHIWTIRQTALKGLLYPLMAAWSSAFTCPKNDV